ncbi:MAG: hypothetical protein NC548_12790 [Lachnospiraceae bacterium]|nr:hypothetical protein [Lachnospiraceae bacterium]MCM1230733.1 hypothetical protein [Ruminococcus flavefaciens]
MGPANNPVIVASFEIPNELATELSNLLTKQVIKERLLLQLLDDREKYNQVENDLVPITARVEAIKLKITKEYVPEEYSSSRYSWSYDGYEVAGNMVYILDHDPQ